MGGFVKPHCLFSLNIFHLSILFFKDFRESTPSAALSSSEKAAERHRTHFTFIATSAVSFRMMPYSTPRISTVAKKDTGREPLKSA